MNKIPIKLTGNPAYVKWKKSNPTPVKSSLNSEIIIFGGVPIFVFIPPKIEAKARGIRNLDGFHFIF